MPLRVCAKKWAPQIILFCIQCLLSLWPPPVTTLSLSGDHFTCSYWATSSHSTWSWQQLRVSLTAAMTVARALLHEAVALFCRCHSGHLRPDQGVSPGLRVKKAGLLSTATLLITDHTLLCVCVCNAGKSVFPSQFSDTSKIKLLLRSACRGLWGEAGYECWPHSQSLG